MAHSNSRFSQEQVSHIILDSLKKGKPVEIEGFGTFQPQPDGGFHFVALNAPRVFIGYAAEDSEKAELLYDSLLTAGLNPWMDRRNLNAGQNWPRLIEAAIEASDFFVGCMSANSVRKRGGFQSEIRYALDIALRLPLEDTFIVPIRFDECSLPARIVRELQYIDFFPSWDDGLKKLTHAIQHQWLKRQP